MRKEKVLQLNDRGNQLQFKVREMPARRLERWLVRAGLLLAGSGFIDQLSGSTTDTGAILQKAGEALSSDGLAVLGNLDFDKVEPLLDELLGCCYQVVDGAEYQLTPDTVDGIIEDVKTLFELRKASLEVNIGFFGIGGLSATPSNAETSPGSRIPKISVS